MKAALTSTNNDDGQLDLRQSAERQAEARLLARVRNGDESASAELVRRYGGRMLSIARRFLHREEECADAVQDAFLAAFRSLDGFKGQATISTWLHRIITNVCLMRLRSRSRHRDVPLDDLLPTFDESGHHTQAILPWAQEDVYNQVARAETRDQVRACIDRLPDAYRTILLLRDIEELDTNQTAQLLGIQSNAVKTRLHRARQALRTLIEPILGDVRSDTSS
jgi:RNA polymerase sigma-70 factor (ECF subfamily)